MPNTKIDVELTSRQLSQLRDDVDDLLARLATAESLWSWWLAGVATQNRSSARNMLHYWAIRQCDLRDLQARLAAYGLSSLGRSEPHVEATLLLVRSAISAMLGDIWQQPPITCRQCRERPRTAPPPNRAVARPGAGRSRDPHHGHTALLGCDRPRLGSRVGGTRREHRTHQLCARRCRGMALHGTACQASGRSDRPNLLGRYGPWGTKAADWTA